MDTKHRLAARKSIRVDGTTGEGHAAVIFRAHARLPSPSFWLGSELLGRQSRLMQIL